MQELADELKSNSDGKTIKEVIATDG